jgi:spermidine synthase
VLIIGGGDGGTARELTRYKTVEHIDLVDIDEIVVEVCREHFKFTAQGLDDKRVQVHIQDGLKFIRSREDEYDLIIVDSTDPFGPGEGLFTHEFYGNCFKALKKDGILVNQHESPYYDY